MIIFHDVNREHSAALPKQHIVARITIEIIPDDVAVGAKKRGQPKKS